MQLKRISAVQTGHTLQFDEIISSTSQSVARMDHIVSSQTNADARAEKMLWSTARIERQTKLLANSQAKIRSGVARLLEPKKAERTAAAHTTDGMDDGDVRI